MNALACELFVNVLRYIGDLPSDVDTAYVAQDIAQLAIDKPALR
jgi:hypothetical protein